jgi:hypothetical protein
LIVEKGGNGARLISVVDSVTGRTNSRKQVKSKGAEYFGLERIGVVESGRNNPNSPSGRLPRAAVCPLRASRWRARCKLLAQLVEPG